MFQFKQKTSLAIFNLGAKSKVLMKENLEIRYIYNTCCNIQPLIVFLIWKMTLIG